MNSKKIISIVLDPTVGIIGFNFLSILKKYHINLIVYDSIDSIIGFFEEYDPRNIKKKKYHIRNVMVSDRIEYGQAKKKNHCAN